MPQELRVVCCFQCRKFQSDIVKKAKKWTCKLCGAQQSLVKEYARGSGKECRLLVQQLSDGSLRADQAERFVAEQVLSGELALPSDVGNPIKEESARLMASREQNRKVEGNQRSKWDSFCVNDDADDGDVFTGNIVTEKSQDNSWTNWGKGKVVDRGRKNSEPSKNLFAFKTQNINEQPSTAPNLVPMVDFHRMDKQDKKQFKWQAKNAKFALQSAGQTTKPVPEIKKTLFSFKPKASTIPLNLTLEDIDTSQSKENVALKRTLDLAADLPTSKPPMMSFAKKSKWANFNSPELELSLPEATPDSDELSQGPETFPEKSSSPASSKWSKYVPQTDEEDDEFS